MDEKSKMQKTQIVCMIHFSQNATKYRPLRSAISPLTEEPGVDVFQASSLVSTQLMNRVTIDNNAGEKDEDIIFYNCQYMNNCIFYYILI